MTPEMKAILEARREQALRLAAQIEEELQALEEQEPQRGCILELPRHYEEQHREYFSESY